MVGKENDGPSATPKDAIDPNQAEAPLGELPKPTVRTKPKRNWRVWEANRKV